MLMKLTPGLNFINALCTAFKRKDPKSVKIQLSCQYLFTLLGSTGAKAARRMLMKLTPGLYSESDYFSILSSAFKIFLKVPLNDIFLSRTVLPR